MAVAVAGGGFSGFTAAVELGRQGVQAELLLERDRVGGFTTGGGGQTDREAGNVSLRCGIVKEFYDRAAGGSVFPTMEAAQNTQNAMLAEVSQYVTVRQGKGVETVTKDPITNAIASIRATGGTDHAASNFVCAGDEGDLPWKAGCTMTIGRESTAMTSIPVAGVRPPTLTTAKAYDPITGQRYPEVDALAVDAIGSADRRLMAFNKRFIVPDPDDPARVQWQTIAVANFNPRRYDGLRAIAKAKGYKEFPASVGRDLIPAGSSIQRDANNGGLLQIGSNWIGRFLRWLSMTWTERNALVAEYDSYALGLFKAIVTDPLWESDCPELVADTKRYGLHPTVFPDQTPPGWSPYLYVRGARRLVGQDYLTFFDGAAPATNKVKDPMVVGGYPHRDRHFVSRRTSPTGYVELEGGAGLSGGYEEVPFLLPLGAMKPWRVDCPNLIVTRCVSGDELAWILTRIELTWGKYGQCGAIVAGLADKAGIWIDDVPYTSMIRPALLVRGMMITVPGVA